MELPLGFNSISNAYLPLIPSPTTSSLLLITQPIYKVEDFLFNSLQSNVITTTLDSNTSWITSLDYIFDYTIVNSTTKFPVISFYCQVFDTKQTPAPSGVNMVLKIIDSNSKLINLPQTINSVTNKKGIANFNLQLNFTTQIDTQLKFVVYPSDKDETTIFLNNYNNKEYIPSLDIVNANNTFLSTQNAVSNKVTIQTAVNGTLTQKASSTSELNLYNTSVTLQNTLVTESVNQIYNDLSTITTSTDTYISPYDTCATSTVESGFRLIQGFTKDQICRYSGWGSKVLLDVHSHLSSNANSEINLTNGTITKNKLNANFLSSSSVTLEKYKNILETIGQHVTATTSTYLSSQTTQGNKVTTSNINQVHAQQVRFNAGANFDIHAGGKVSFVANQFMSNCKWVNIASDTYQQISQHYWLRSENVLSIMGKDTFRYNHSSLQEYSANSLIASGQKIEYNDVLWNQIGQANAAPLHPSRSKNFDYKYDGSNKIPYGTAINISMQDYHIVSKYGHLRFRATQHMKFLSDMGGFYFRAVSSSFVTDTKNATIKSLKEARITSQTRVAINAPMVCINCTNITPDSIEAIVDNTSETISKITTVASASSIIGQSVSVSGLVSNAAGDIIAATVNPILNAAGEVVHSVVDKLGNIVGVTSTSALNNLTTVVGLTNLTNQPSVQQALVAKKENLSSINYSNYIPMSFSSLSDPASTTKTTSGASTGPAIQVGSKLPNPGSVSLGGPAGSGSAN